MSRTRHAYDRWAARYDSDPNPQTLLEEGPVLALVAARRGDRILDAACGTGRYCQHFHDAEAEVAGIDFSQAMLDRARDGLPFVAFYCVDLTDGLPFDDESFDKVNCAQALKHLFDLDRVIREFARVLRSGGTLTFSVTHPDMDWDGYELAYTPSFILSAQSDIYAHRMDDYVEAIASAELELRQLVEVSVDKTIQHLLTPESFAKVKSRPQIAVFHCSRA